MFTVKHLLLASNPLLQIVESAGLVLELEQTYLLTGETGLGVGGGVGRLVGAFVGGFVGTGVGLGVGGVVGGAVVGFGVGGGFVGNAVGFFVGTGVGLAVGGLTGAGVGGGVVGAALHSPNVPVKPVGLDIKAQRYVSGSRLASELLLPSSVTMEFTITF